jgi:hypothetical protein
MRVEGYSTNKEENMQKNMHNTYTPYCRDNVYCLFCSFSMICVCEICVSIACTHIHMYIYLVHVYILCLRLVCTYIVCSYVA